MSIFEWMGESVNPGSWGSMESHDGREEARRQRTRGSVLVGGLVSLALLLAPIGFVFANGGTDTVKFAGMVAGGELLYLCVGYLLRPAPDTSNLGWFGGLMDDPFRASDDWNRFLLYLKILLLPGRLLAVGVMDMATMLWSD